MPPRRSIRSQIRFNHGGLTHPPDPTITYTQEAAAAGQEEQSAYYHQEWSSWRPCLAGAAAAAKNGTRRVGGPCGKQPWTVRVCGPLMDGMGGSIEIETPPLFPLHSTPTHHRNHNRRALPPPGGTGAGLALFLGGAATIIIRRGGGEGRGGVCPAAGRAAAAVRAVEGAAVPGLQQGKSCLLIGACVLGLVYWVLWVEGANP